MPKISRVELHRSSEIPAPASEVWALLGDWAGMLRWWPTADQGAPPGPKLVKCDLVGEHGAVPRMRRMTLDNGVVIEERIFYQSDEARRIYYTKTEPAASQLSGYLASAYVDEIDGHTCMMHFSSWFDARAASSAAAVRFEAIYQAIFDGFRKYGVSQAEILAPAGDLTPYLIATLHFDDMSAIMNAFASPEGQACSADRRLLVSDMGETTGRPLRYVEVSPQEAKRARIGRGSGEDLRVGPHRAGPSGRPHLPFPRIPRLRVLFCRQRRAHAYYPPRFRELIASGSFSCSLRSRRAVTISIVWRAPFS